MDLPRKAQLDDESIVRLIRAGRARGVEALLEKFGGPVKKLICNRYPLADEHYVDQAIADAIGGVKAFDSSKGVSLKWWFGHLSWQKWISILRGNAPWTTRTKSIGRIEFRDPRQEGPLEELLRRETAEDISEVIRTVLSDLEAAVIRMDMDTDWNASAKMIATVLGCKDATSVYSARRRAHRKLESALSRYKSDLRKNRFPNRILE